MRGTDRQREPDRDDYNTFERLPHVLNLIWFALLLVIAVWFGILWVF